MTEHLASSGHDPSSEAPLAGLVVLELTRVITGPYIGRVFADYGARVIRVQSAKYPDTVGTARGARDPRLVQFSHYNVNKESVSLDLRHERGREVFLRLVEQADVLIENNAPGVMQRLDLEYERLREVNPRLIMLSSALLIGPEPWSRFRGYGTQAVGLAGFQSLVGYPDETHPNGLTAPYTDFIAPPIAVTAILAALRRRRRTGEGEHIVQGQGQSSLFALAGLLAAAPEAGERLSNAGNYDREMYPHDCYQGSDGQWIALAVRDARDWAALASLVPFDGHIAALAEVEERRAQHHAIERSLQRWVEEQPAAERVRLLVEAGIPAGEVHEPATLWDQPQLAFSQHWEMLTDHGDPIAIQNLPYRMDGRIEHWRSFASPGEDTYSVLQDLLDLSSEEIADLYASGALD